MNNRNNNDSSNSNSNSNNNNNIDCHRNNNNDDDDNNNIDCYHSRPRVQLAPINEGEEVTYPIGTTIRKQFHQFTHTGKIIEYDDVKIGKL